jgi:hypothetical protein
MQVSMSRMVETTVSDPGFLHTSDYPAPLFWNAVTISSSWRVLADCVSLVVSFPISEAGGERMFGVRKNFIGDCRANMNESGEGHRFYRTGSRKNLNRRFHVNVWTIVIPFVIDLREWETADSPTSPPSHPVR